MYEKYSFYTPYWDAFTKYGHKYCRGFETLCVFCFLCFLLLVCICQDNLSIKSRNVLLLNIGKMHLINFVAINLLERFSWAFFAKKSERVHKS